jgi:hypothetical protein
VTVTDHVVVSSALTQRSTRVRNTFSPFPPPMPPHPSSMSFRLTAAASVVTPHGPVRP